MNNKNTRLLINIAFSFIVFSTPQADPWQCNYHLKTCASACFTCKKKTELMETINQCEIYYIQLLRDL